MADYREDFNANWDWYAKNFTRNNEYLIIQFKNGDSYSIVDNDWFEENTSFPRFKASDILFVSRYYGDGCEIITAMDIEVDTTRIKLFDKEGKVCFSKELSEQQQSDIRRQLWDASWDLEGSELSMLFLDICRRMAKPTHQR